MNIVTRSESYEPPRGARAGWSSGSRRRKMGLTVEGGHSRASVRDGGHTPAQPADQPERYHEQAGHDQPRYEQPRNDQPRYEPPRYEQAGHDQPRSDQPRYEQARNDQPRYEPPRYEQARHEQPAYGQAQYERTRDLPYDQDRDRDHPDDQSARPGYADQPQQPRGQTPPPRKLTVTRVVAWRSRQLTEQGIRAFQRAAGADGADRSGLRALTYATMLNYATDAAVAVALANTLFFSAATAESKSKVALYLLITVAPFAVVAPVIGPLLDRVQRGRRAALAASFVGRGLLVVVMAFHFNDWWLYPAALGVMVLSKSFTVLRAAVTPRVLPEAITLVTTNSRLTAFGLVAGGVFGAIAAGLAHVTGSEGALFYTAVLCGLGTWLCLRIPRWVEVTEGEVPAALRNRAPTSRRQPMGRHVVVALWANSAIRVLTGFLMLFVAFAVKAQTEQDPFRQLILLGIVGATAGVGSFIGNAVGARQLFARSDSVLFGCVGGCAVGAIAAAVLPGITLAAVCALMASTASALAKVCLDAVIQRDLPERSRASAFGRSETVLQLAWVFGGALGVLLPPVYWIGFATAAAMVTLLGAQAVLISRGRSLLPWIRHRQPIQPPPSDQ